MANMKKKLFWPLVAVAGIAVLVTAFVIFDSESDDEVAARFIPGYNAAGAPNAPTAPMASNGPQAARPGAAMPNPARVANPPAGAGSVLVNGQLLSAQAMAMLTGGRGGVPPGRYWYDARSGLWGLMGGPARGQIQAGLRIGGPLPANASGGGTNVFFNGRELHPAEVLYIRQRLGTAIPGRYWLNPDLSGGPEGGPKLFSLARRGYNRNTAGGSILGDGRGCSGVLVPNRPGGPSTTVMSGC